MYQIDPNRGKPGIELPNGKPAIAGHDRHEPCPAGDRFDLTAGKQTLRCRDNGVDYRLAAHSSSLEAADDVRMTSTTDVSARVVVSPNGRFCAISRSNRRMILPLRILGRSGVNMTDLGRAIGPMTFPTCCRSSFPSSGVPSTPDLMMTKEKIASPVSSSGTPTTAASATEGCDTRA